MKTLKLEVYSNIYDDDYYKIVDKHHKFTATYFGEIDIQKLEGDLYGLLGEGIKVSTNHNDLYSIVTIDLLGDRSIEKLTDYLKGFEIVSESPDIFKSFANTEFEEYIQFSTVDVYLSENEFEAINKIFKENGVNYKILSGNEIYEKGASSHWASYLIGVAGGLTVQLTMRLFDVLKEKISEKEDIDVLKIQTDIKARLVNEYDLKPSELYLSRFFNKRDDKIIELTYKTTNSVIRVQTDEKGNIIKLNKSEKGTK